MRAGMETEVIPSSNSAALFLLLCEGFCAVISTTNKFSKRSGARSSGETSDGLHKSPLYPVNRSRQVFKSAA